jgi:hypothetical protein
MCNTDLSSSIHFFFEKSINMICKNFQKIVFRFLNFPVYPGTDELLYTADSVRGTEMLPSKNILFGIHVTACSPVCRKLVACLSTKYFIKDEFLDSLGTFYADWHRGLFRNTREPLKYGFPLWSRRRYLLTELACDLSAVPRVSFILIFHGVGRSTAEIAHWCSLRAAVSRTRCGWHCLTREARDTSRTTFPRPEAPGNKRTVGDIVAVIVGWRIILKWILKTSLWQQGLAFVYTIMNLGFL